MYCLYKWNFYVREYEKFRSKLLKLETISLNEPNFWPGAAEEVRDRSDHLRKASTRQLLI